MNNMTELRRLYKYLPGNVTEDISKRVNDWVNSGGDYSDPYILQQLNYAKMYLQAKGVKVE